MTNFFALATKDGTQEVFPLKYVVLVKTCVGGILFVNVFRTARSAPRALGLSLSLSCPRSLRALIYFAPWELITRCAYLGLPQFCCCFVFFLELETDNSLVTLLLTRSQGRGPINSDLG